MHTGSHIIDNEGTKAFSYLRRELCHANAFDFVSAYFSIYGYELLEDELSGIDRVRFLFGDPASAEDIDPSAKEQKSFQITETGLAPNHTLVQKSLARRCAEWVGKCSVNIRSVRHSNFLHGKMYVIGAGGQARSAVVGSSNFTKRGLGGSDWPNLEINLVAEDRTTLAEIQNWFEDLWNDETRTEDVKKQVLAELLRIGADQTPERVYYKTLYELFRKELEARKAGEEGIESVGFYKSEIWNALYEFQKDGVKSAIARLKEHNGCILADGVGLGKTYTALAVIRYFEQRNERVLVLCSRKLFNNWELYQSSRNYSQNPFPGDRFGYTLLAHTDLSRDSGDSGGVDLARINWQNYDLVVIDESHNFRNREGQRYRKLLDEVIKSGGRTKVLMLSATPVNTSLSDLSAQIDLITEGCDDRFGDSLGVSDVGEVMRQAQKKFRAWEERYGKSPRERRNKTELLEELGSEFLRLLSGISIARSRRQIQKHYSAEMERIGQFPEHERPVNRYPPTDLANQLSYEQLSQDISKFGLIQYRPSEYLKGSGSYDGEIGKKDSQWNREYYLVGMMRTNFLKRLESSANSLALTLERSIEKIDNIILKIDRYRSCGEGNLFETDLPPEMDEDEEEMFVGKGMRQYQLSELDLPRWRTDLIADREALHKAYDSVRAVDAKRDGKLKQIMDDIRERVASPTYGVISKSGARRI